jgi:hypothetical protein
MENSHLKLPIVMIYSCAVILLNNIVKMISVIIMNKTLNVAHLKTKPYILSSCVIFAAEFKMAATQTCMALSGN